MQSPMIKVKEVTEASLWKQYVRRLTAYVCSMFDLLNLNLEQTGELPEDCVLDDPCRPKWEQWICQWNQKGGTEDQERDRLSDPWDSLAEARVASTCWFDPCWNLNHHCGSGLSRPECSKGIRDDLCVFEWYGLGNDYYQDQAREWQCHGPIGGGKTMAEVEG